MAELASKAHLAAVVHVLVVEVVVICRVHSVLAQRCHISQAYWRNSQHDILCQVTQVRGKAARAHEVELAECQPDLALSADVSAARQTASSHFVFVLARS